MCFIKLQKKYLHDARVYGRLNAIDNEVEDRRSHERSKDTQNVERKDGKINVSASSIDFP